MPVCHRCERMLPTGELRRTSRGFLCKDNDRFSVCARVTRAKKAAKRS